jgi:hypothetical protein
MLASIPVTLIVVGTIVLSLEVLHAKMTGANFSRKVDRLQGELDSVSTQYNKSAGSGSNFTPKKKKKKKR